jgi:hypothetical protein
MYASVWLQQHAACACAHTGLRAAWLRHACRHAGGQSPAGAALALCVPQAALLVLHLVQARSLHVIAVLASAAVGVRCAAGAHHPGLCIEHYRQRHMEVRGQSLQYR